MGLAFPSSPYTVPGRTKMPDPMTPLSEIAIKPSRPTARTSLAVAGRLWSCLGSGWTTVDPIGNRRRKERLYTLFRIESDVLLKICRFSCSGIASSFIEETARSIEPSMCG